jgi:hypothetical protein
MPIMKLTHILLATSFAAAATTTFAATPKQPQTEEKVIVSTQEQPETSVIEGTAAQPSTQPAVDSASEATPAQ